jgi:hypothetical protein
MTREEKLGRCEQRLIQACLPENLARGYLRYEVVRKLTAPEFVVLVKLSQKTITVKTTWPSKAEICTNRKRRTNGPCGVTARTD